MEQRTRRELLSEIGKGMLTASLGVALSSEMGLSSVLADSGMPDNPLDFGRLEPLVQMMQENSAEKLLPLVVAKLNKAESLRDIVAAAALANARTFGGEDYIGFHAFMAMAPAYQMATEMPADRRHLPVLKVLYRSTQQIQARGGRTHEILQPIEELPAAGNCTRETLQQAALNADMSSAEMVFAGIISQSQSEAYNDLQALIQDDTDVHRVVMAYRAWDLLGFTGREHAHTTLRQSVRYCVSTEQKRKANKQAEPGIRAALPKILIKYHVEDLKFGDREADDIWVNELCNTLMDSAPSVAAEAIANAIAEGFSSLTIGEALSLAATRRVLTDPGRSVEYPGKPVGSVHGDSVGVHASDSMNAWRNMAKVSNPYNAMTGLIVGGYHLAVATSNDWKQRQPYNVYDHADRVKIRDEEGLLKQLNDAVRANNQAQAAAITRQFGEQGYSARPVFDLLLQYATSEDGALHAEKYYRTANEEFGRTRSAYRWEHVIALARVTASEYGKRAEGYAQACDLLKIKA